MYFLQETHFSFKDSKLKVKGWNKIDQANSKQKRGRVAILRSDKVDFQIIVTKDKEGHYIMAKGFIYKENILETYMNLTTQTQKYIKHKITY